MPGSASPADHVRSPSRPSRLSCGANAWPDPAGHAGVERRFEARSVVSLRERFRAVSAAVSCAFGSPWALATAIALVIVWALSGRYFHYSDAWQLVINTGTTIVTFLMAFLIQATQYRESRALHLKIDELIRAVHGARNGFVNLESLSDDQLEALAVDLQRYGAKTKILPIAPAKAVATRRKSSSRPKRNDARGTREQTP